ncbi:MAG: hypothetical protein K0U79_19615 [Gammaproteobacteria bacterium]|nr:hypothetical protein [Gammaproteobacteria bacterium]
MNRELLRAGRLPALMLLAQLMLLGFNLLSAHAGLGHLHTVFSIAIPVLMAGIVMIWAMHLRQRSGAVRLTALLGFAFWAVLAALTLADQLARVPVPPPW